MSNNPNNIQKGDKVTISAQGIKVTGDVVYVQHYTPEGYDMELNNANVPGGYSHWKQWADGGKVLSVNGKEV